MYLYLTVKIKEIQISSLICKEQFYLQEQSDTVMYNFIIDIL